MDFKVRHIYFENLYNSTIQKIINANRLQNKNVNSAIENVNIGDTIVYENNEFTYKLSGNKNNIKQLIPDTDSLYDLGNSTNKFKSLYVSSDTIYIGSSKIT